jgi:hypothetical protein
MRSSFEQSVAQALLDRGGPVPEGIVASNGQSAARRFGVYRNNVFEVEVRLLPSGGAVFLRALGEGRSLDEAADLALAVRSDFNLAFNLAGLIGWGLIREVIVARAKERRS